MADSPKDERNLGDEALDQKFIESDPQGNSISKEEQPTSEGSLNQEFSPDELPTVAMDEPVASAKNPGERIPSPPIAPPLDSGVIAEKPGDIIGAFKLLQKIGEGGFGVVYMAEQRVPIKRRVALKIIKPGMDSREVIARFEAERQALALMEHSNISRVLDAGATEAGRPYFVMELVKGVPITEYCDTHQVDTRRRLELFQNICDAVQHAHQKGIIHRDLKPSNILVTHGDSGPEVKVIDFGIAKAISQELTERTMFTSLGQMIGTPQYMSPEQSAVSGLDVDTRSDIYSLGVVLYELLTGRTPLDPKRLREAGIDEIHRIIREEEPARPSTRLSSLDGEEFIAVARYRHETPEKFRRMVRGDLDWIVMKALEKDRNRRYESASSFSDDVGRFLNLEPVWATPPSSAYRILKFVRRNRAALVTTALIFTTLLTATGVSIRQASIANRAKANAEIEAENARIAENLAENRLVQIDEQRKAAEKGRAEAEAAALLIEEMLGAASPLSGMGADLTVREMLDIYSEKLDAQLQSQPEVEFRVRNTLGKAFFSLDEWERAEPQLRKAYELSKSIHGEDSEITAGVASVLGKVLIELERREEAQLLLRKAAEVIENVDGLPDEKKADVFGSLAKALSRGPEAEKYYHQALELAGYTKSKGSIQIALLLDGLRQMYAAGDGEINEPRAVAMAIHEESIGMIERIKGNDAPELIPILYDYLLGGRRLGLTPEKLDNLRQRIKTLAYQHYGDHPRTAEWLFQMGWNYRLTGGDLDRADRYFTEAREVILRAIEKGRGSPGEAYYMLGFYALDSGERELGRNSLRKAIEYYESTEYPRLWSYRAALTKLADMTLDKKEAITLYEKAFNVLDKMGASKQSASYGYDLAGFGKVLIKAREWQRAEETLRESGEIFWAAKGYTGHHFPWESLASLLQTQSRYQEALEIWNKLSAFYGSGTGWYEKQELAHRGIAACQLKLGNNDLAEEAAKQAIAYSEKNFGRGAALTSAAIMSLVRVHQATGKLEEAEGLLSTWLDTQTGTGAAATGRRIQIIFELANIKQSQQEFDAAEALYRDAIMECERIGNRSSQIFSYWARIASVKRNQKDLSGTVEVLLEAIQFCRMKLGDKNPKLPTLYYDLGRAYQSSGDLESAEAAFRERLVLLQNYHPTDIKSITGALDLLGTTQRDRGDPNDAEQFFAKAYDIWKRESGDDAPETLKAAFALATHYRKIGKYDESLALSETVFQIRRKNAGIENVETLKAMRLSGAAMRSLGRFSEAAERLGEARILMEKANHPETLSTLYELGMALRLGQQYEEAAEVFSERLKRMLESGAKASSIVSNYHELGIALWQGGKRDRAITTLRDKAAIQKREFGDRSFDVGVTLVGLGDYLSNEKRYREAIEAYQEALAIFEESNRDATRRPEAMSKLADTLKSSGDLKAALTAKREAVRSSERILGPNDPKTLFHSSVLGDWLRQASHHDEAISILSGVLERQRRLPGPDDPSTLLTMRNLGTAYSASHLHKKALSIRGEAIPKFESIHGTDSPSTVSLKRSQASTLRSLSRLDDAISLLRETIEAGEGKLGPAHHEIIGSRQYLGHWLVEAKRYTEAEPVIRACIQGRKQKDPGHWRIFSDKSLLGHTLSRQAKFEEAEQLLLEGYEGLKERKPALSSGYLSHLRAAIARLSSLYKSWNKPEKEREWRKVSP